MNASLAMLLRHVLLLPTFSDGCSSLPVAQVVSASAREQLSAMIALIHTGCGLQQGFADTAKAWGARRSNVHIPHVKLAQL